MPNHFSKYRFYYLIGALIVGCGSSYWAYYDTFKDTPISGQPADWGTFGDYIGGVSGTIFSIISVILLYVTLQKQAQYSITQQFEPSFFNLITNQREIRKGLHGYVYVDHGNDNGWDTNPSGDGYIKAVSEELDKKLTIFNSDDLQKTIDSAYGQEYKDKAGELGHYFRHLYHIVKYTHESDVANKKKYVDILQAQMSDDELFLTFYNAIYKHGKDEFLPLLDEYGFFENIRSRGENFDKHKAFFFPKTIFKHNYESAVAEAVG